ncbi:MAG TPA: tyrosine/phenylalanine carboxypeptidase domain-containing protein [Polyangiaceae bacterium]|jgi:hypothetical protein|nr:tyrosine/phenylalanine carboxypeptidase domain-containing protein [Polyangiaceae bacterium]
MTISPLPRGVIELDQSPLFRDAARLLARAETEIRLIDRAQPRNAAAEREALIAAWGAGKPRAPRFEYAARANFGELRRALAGVARSLEAEGPLGTLYAERARELELEAELAECIDTTEFAAHCAQRYAALDAADAARASGWATRWLDAADDRAEALLHRSDDRGDAKSLVSALERASEGLPVRLEIRPNQAAAASVGEGFIGLRPGLWHSEREVRRIVLHEIEGHARPRVLAQREPLALFRIGAARSSDDEEGRALLLERRARVLEGSRRRELARRHLAAERVRAGASFVGTVSELIERGQDIESSVEAACRAFRGGGLGREYVYLSALARVQRVFADEPELERWLERGRLSIAAARALAALSA